MNVQELMHSDVKTCCQGDTLNRAAQLMWDGDCGCVPVVDDDRRVVGILTDRDVCMAAYTQGKSLQELPVELAMSKEVFAVGPETTLTAAEALLGEKQIRRLPVVDNDGRLLGIVSLSDIARQLAREQRERRKSALEVEIGKTLAAICEPRVPMRIPASPGAPRRKPAVA